MAAVRDFPVSEALAERLRGWLEQPAEGAGARRAATVVLVRDAGLPGSGVQAYLLRRRTAMAFAAGMHVFPGGGVDERDGTDLPWGGPPPAWWSRTMGVDEQTARKLVCAAVRETFEECGVLLAGRPGTGTAAAGCEGEEWEQDRCALAADETSLAEVLGRRGLELRSDLLRPWAHWTTPVFEPRRFDTWFFLAALPAGQRARHVGGEATASGWRGAVEALADAAAGRSALMPPTLVTLEEAAAAASVAELWCQPRTLTEVLPHPVTTPGGTVLRTQLPAAASTP